MTMTVEVVTVIATFATTPLTPTGNRAWVRAAQRSAGLVVVAQ
jgi:hypothetical protein